MDVVLLQTAGAGFGPTYPWRETVGQTGRERVSETLQTLTTRDHSDD